MSSWWITFFILIIIVMVFLIIVLLRRYYSPVKRSSRPIDQGNIPIPEKRSIKWKRRSELKDQIIKEWSSTSIPSWKKEGKVKAPRTMLAKLHEGNDIKGVNKTLIGLRRWGEVGSTWLLNRKGDYDFTLVPLVAILYLFGKDENILSKETRDHLVDHLHEGIQWIIHGDLPRSCQLSLEWSVPSKFQAAQ